MGTLLASVLTKVGISKLFKDRGDRGSFSLSYL
jgi:hypothetical protein